MDSTGSHQVFRYLSAIYQDVFYTMHTRYKIHTTIHKYLDTCCNPIEAFILLLYIQLYIIEKFVSSPFLSGYAVPCISIRTLNVLQSEPLRQKNVSLQLLLHFLQQKQRSLPFYGFFWLYDTVHECLYTWRNSIETFAFSIVFNITIEEYFSIVRSFLLAIETMFIAFLCVHYCVGIVLCIVVQRTRQCVSICNSKKALIFCTVFSTLLQKAVHYQFLKFLSQPGSNVLPKYGIYLHRLSYICIFNKQLTLDQIYRKFQNVTRVTYSNRFKI